MHHTQARHSVKIASVGMQSDWTWWPLTIGSHREKADKVWGRGATRPTPDVASTGMGQGDVHPEWLALESGDERDLSD